MWVFLHQASAMPLSPHYMAHSGQEPVIEFPTRRAAKRPFKGWKMQSRAGSSLHRETVRAEQAVEIEAESGAEAWISHEPSAAD